MCDDIGATVRDLRAKGIVVQGEPQDQGWGISVMLALPGGVEVQLTNLATLLRPRSAPNRSPSPVVRSPP